jgi:hypothetical protein
MHRILSSLAFVATLTLSGCADSGGTGPTPPPVPSPGQSVTGTWTGTASDSSTMNAVGRLMGQSDMAPMTWVVEQTGSRVSATVRFSGIGAGDVPGTVTGTMEADDMPFDLELPAGAMAGVCMATARGTLHVDRTTMTMTGSYAGSNTCVGPFNDGHMTLAKK